MSARAGLIFLTGLDGSGKTTQAKRLIEVAPEGWTYRWVRWEPWLTRPLMSLARHTLSPAGGGQRPEDDQGHARFRDRKRGLFRRRWLRAVWTTVVLLEYLPQAWWRLAVPMVRGRTIVCDRYWPDVLVDLAMNYGTGSEGVEQLAGHPLLNLFPAPSTVVYFDVDPQVGYDRKRDGTPLAYLEDRHPVYHAWAERAGAIVLDANRPLEDVQAALREALLGGDPGHTDRRKPVLD